jgi:hypothetical protein
MSEQRRRVIYIRASIDDSPLHVITSRCLLWLLRGALGGLWRSGGEGDSGCTALSSPVVRWADGGRTSRCRCRREVKAPRAPRPLGAVPGPPSNVFVRAARRRPSSAGNQWKPERDR